MNYTETFNEFASKSTPLDLALYAGLGLILWVLFKDKLTPVQKFILDLTKKVYPSNSSDFHVLPSVPDVSLPKNIVKEDVFFKLVASWKQTRDLAVQSHCAEAIKVADQMFPFLSPNACQDQPTLPTQTK
jgi:hypothetical protein